MQVHLREYSEMVVLVSSEDGYEDASTEPAPLHSSMGASRVLSRAHQYSLSRSVVSGRIAPNEGVNTRDSLPSAR